MAQNELDKTIAMNLCKHKTSIMSLMEVFELNGKEDELFYRKIVNRTNGQGVLYHSYEDLNICESLADKYMNSMNSKLYWKPESKIKKLGKFYYIKQHEDSTKNIVDKLIELSNDGVQD